MKRIAAYARGFGKAMGKHGGQIAYYGGVALALTAIAFAAEQYRAKPDVEAGAPVLPAVELSAPAEAEAQEEAFRAPEGGELLRAFSREPAWNGELRLWENHEAADYRLQEDAVMCLSGGVVRTVGRSGLYGGFVEIECGEYLLRYASIAPREDLAPGMELAIGDPIGAADASMPGEAGLGAHLHLEVLRGEVREDFAALTDRD